VSLLFSTLNWMMTSTFRLREYANVLGIFICAYSLSARVRMAMNNPFGPPGSTYTSLGEDKIDRHKLVEIEMRLYVYLSSILEEKECWQCIYIVLVGNIRILLSVNFNESHGWICSSQLTDFRLAWSWSVAPMRCELHNYQVSCSFFHCLVEMRLYILISTNKAHPH